MAETGNTRFCQKQGEKSMKMKQWKLPAADSLTKGAVLPALIRFSLPYLLAVFLQQLYGLADLFAAGMFNGADIVTAVSVGSQFLHMFTAVTIGLAAGVTVAVSRAAGAGEEKELEKAVNASFWVFGVYAVLMILLLFSLPDVILQLLQVPQEAFEQARLYLLICFAGIPFIVAYNVISCIYRGRGDSITPLVFVAAACISNIALDFLFMGPFGMKAAGAALATVLGQILAVALAFAHMKKTRFVERSALFARPSKKSVKALLEVGVPIAFQDGFIQIAFLIITAIGNSRGLTDAAAIGITEKIISFLFLVPSSLSQSLSAMAGQNVGAGLYERASRALWDAIFLCLGWSTLMIVLCETAGSWLIGLFISDPAVIQAGAVYLSSYILDLMGVSFHFCLGTYFCVFHKSGLSFLQNFLSVVLFRIPLAWGASKAFPDTLFYMGLAAPAGSLFQALLCLFFYRKDHALFCGKTRAEFQEKTA